MSTANILIIEDDADIREGPGEEREDWPAQWLGHDAEHGRPLGRRGGRKTVPGRPAVSLPVFGRRCGRFLPALTGGEKHGLA